MTPEGLLPASQASLRLHGRIARHAYEGLAFDADEQARLVTRLGTLDGMLLDHHGTLTVGRTVAEAFVLMHLFERAAQSQLTAMAACGGRILRVADEVAARTQRQWIGDGSARDGDDEWPALLRGLDRSDPDFRD
jgi:ribulose-5-phosphate 4-epimerase/fuculose-1-phosphate aldolase